MTLTDYLKKKIESKEGSIKIQTKRIVNAAIEMKIDELKSSTVALQNTNDDIKDLVRDFAKHCNVADVVINKELFEEYKYDLGYSYQYTRTVTLAERDLLIKTFGYHVRDAKVA